MKITKKKIEETVTLKLRGKWQNVTLRTFDRLLFKDCLIWSNKGNCFVGLTKD